MLNFLAIVLLLLSVAHAIYHSTIIDNVVSSDTQKAALNVFQSHIKEMKPFSKEPVLNSIRMYETLKKPEDKLSMFVRNPLTAKVETESDSWAHVNSKDIYDYGWESEPTLVRSIPQPRPPKKPKKEEDRLKKFVPYAVMLLIILFAGVYRFAVVDN